MPDNRTLDEFGADDPAPEADVAPTEDDRAGSLEAEVGDGDDAETPKIKPIDGVFRYDPVSIPCDGCGDEVARRWRDGDRYVCERCKPW